MAKKRVRLSGADIRYVNKIRGSDEPVYEVTDNKEMYRPLLTEEEIRLLDTDRKRRMQNLADLLLTNDQFDSKKYDVVISITHKKKQYNHQFSSRTK